MKLWSNAFADNAPIPGEFAFCVPDAANHVALSSNRNPDLHWDGAPAETRSFVLVAHDPDVPTVGDDVNRPTAKCRPRCRARTSSTGCWWTYRRA